jgi:hypothetical protein
MSSPEKLVIRPFRAVKRITFMFEDSQQSFDVAVVPMQWLNDRPRTVQQGLSKAMPQSSLPMISWRCATCHELRPQ